MTSDQSLGRDMVADQFWNDTRKDRAVASKAGQFCAVARQLAKKGTRGGKMSAMECKPSPRRSGEDVLNRRS
jgi:hypothetical protein